MSLEARRELAAVVCVHYKGASKSRKSQILNEFVLATGYNRKYALGVLDRAGSRGVKAAAPARRRRCRKYGPDVEQALVSLWRVSGGLCAKRLVPFLSELVEALERAGEIHLLDAVRHKLLSMSASTADRLLGNARRQTQHGVSTTLAGTLLRHQIPIRTYEDWTENSPGFVEIDLVAHCGGTSAGDYCYTLTVTDVCTGWTECIAIPNRSQIAVTQAMEQVRNRLPFPLLGIDSDNGGEFINHLLKNWCDKHKITFTRCRPYRKNDQCHVEQKNGAVVRPLVGYARYEGGGACSHLNRLYNQHRLSLNYFEPSMKLIGKTRNGARVKKIYDEAKTPWQRLKSLLVQDQRQQDRLSCMNATYLSLNPAKLRRNLHDIEMMLPRFAVKHSQPEPPPAPGKRNTAIQEDACYAQNA